MCEATGWMENGGSVQFRSPACRPVALSQYYEARTIMSVMREPNAEPIPGYRLIEPLGCGGFGEVWKCEAPGGLFKAIKFVFGNLNDLDNTRVEGELQAVQ